MEEEKQSAMRTRGSAPSRGRRNDRYAGKEQRSVVESIREATGASIEEIQYQLRECGGDVNKATEKLIDTPFTVVQSKKPKTKLKPTAGRGRGGGRGNGSTKGRRYDGAGTTTPPMGFGSLTSVGRGRGGRNADPSRGRGQGRHTGGSGRGRTEAEADVMNGDGEKKAKPIAPPAPLRKAYLEALCGKPKPTVPEGMVASGFLVPKQDLASFVARGWEAASSPPDTPVAAFRGPEEPEEVASEDGKSEHVDSVADVKTGREEEEAKSWAEEVEDAQGRDAAVELVPPRQEIFPLPMEDLRFTREDTTWIEPRNLPIPTRIEPAAFGPSASIERGALAFDLMYGTFRGIPPSCPEAPQPSASVREESHSAQETTSAEPENVERLPSTSFRAEEEVETEIRRPRPSLERLPSSVDPPAPQTSGAASDFMLETESKDLDAEIPQATATQQPETGNTFSTTKEETSGTGVSLIPTDVARPAEKPFASSVPLQGTKPPPRPLPSLEEPSAADFGKSYDDGFGVKVENPKAEEISSASFEETRPHRPTSNLADSKPVLEADTSFGISSGPAPSLAPYQTQRNPPPHKLQEKPVLPVGPAVTGHQPSQKYTSHPSAGVPPSGPAVHVPSSLNPSNNSGNPSLPMVPQIPFVNHGMMPSPAMPFPTGTPYYPQFMQYQHQMYHGLYAGTYGSFGAPFNHESVGHPAHASLGKPPQAAKVTSVHFSGVPPNQGNQQFPVSFPNTLYTLGNTVYDAANPTSFGSTKEKDNVFLNQQQQQLSHAGFPGGPQPVRNEGSVFYGVPGQAFSQGFRNQFPQPPGFGQFPGGGFVAPSHTYHPQGQQGNNFRPL